MFGTKKPTRHAQKAAEAREEGRSIFSVRLLWEWGDSDAAIEAVEAEGFRLEHVATTHLASSARVSGMGHDVEMLLVFRREKEIIHAIE